jgi:hypothetical protein
MPVVHTVRKKSNAFFLGLLVVVHKSKVEALVPFSYDMEL